MRVWLALALFAVAGCSFASPDVPMIENSCANDAGCVEGVCDENICIDDTGASVDVVIEVLRDPSDLELATPASWAVGPESFSESSALDVLLPATREVRGLVRWDGVRVPATLRFVRRMDTAVAPLEPVPVEVDTLRETSGGDGTEAYDFSTALVAGETYDVRVLPSSDMVMTPTQGAAPAIRSLPPLYLAVRIAGGDSAEPFRLDVSFPAELAEGCTEDVVIGCTLSMQVLSVADDEELPEAGLQVRAIDKQTARVVSSVGETNESGIVAIRVSEDASDYLIRVTSSAEGDPFPSVSVDPDVAFTKDPPERRIYIPRLAPVQFTGRVLDVDDSAVPGATVRFLSIGVFDGSPSGLEGSFSASVVTDVYGIFAVELLPGAYSISVTPPEDVENTWGVLTLDALAGEGLTEAEPWVLPSQISLRGQVETFQDELASGVTVLARARLGEDLGIVHRSQEVVSNEMGDYELGVDTGLYDMHLKMSSETGFAWLIEPELVMSPALGDLERDYRLVPPIPVRGVIRAGDGAAVPNASIRAYVFANVEGGASRPIQVAETVSDEDGNYRLLLTPRLGDE